MLWHPARPPGPMTPRADPWITSDGLPALPRVVGPALVRLLSDDVLEPRQRTMIAALLTVLSVSDLESVSPALHVAYRETVSALTD